MKMNKADLEILADLRVGEGQALLAAGFWAGAYYLVGYGVECAVKACIAKSIDRHDFPDKKLAEKSYSHDLASLVQAASLKADLDLAMAASPKFKDNWVRVLAWNEEKRYDHRIRQADAEALIEAIVDPNDGVLSWLKKHWI